MARIDKENYYLDIAETVLKRATCLRRCYGAIIVKICPVVTSLDVKPSGIHGAICIEAVNMIIE